MNTVKKITGIALATGAAGLFLSAAVTASAAEEAIIHCAGVNACKGQGRCAAADHSCKGANACNELPPVFRLPRGGVHAARFCPG